MKLTMSFKDKLVRSVVDKTFEARRKDVELKEQALAYDVYCIIYPEEIRKKMNDLPQGFFTDQRGVWVDKFRLDMDHPLPISARDNYLYHSPSLDANSRWYPDMRAKALEIEELKLTIDKDYFNLRDNLYAFLRGITTEKRLNEEWPDWTMYMDAPEGAVKNLPSIRCEDINEMIKESGVVK